MRIGFNALFLKQPMTGSGQYARNLLAELNKLDRENDYLIVGPSPHAGGARPATAVCNGIEPADSAVGAVHEPPYAHGAVREPPLPGGRLSNTNENRCNGRTEFRYVEAKTPFDSFSRQLSKVWFEQAGLPHVSRLERTDLIHYPYLAAPLVAPCRVVVTVHDVIPLLLAPYRGSAMVRLYATLVSAGARRAAAIITDSASSKADIVSVLEIPTERISVIYLAVDDCFRVEENADLLRRVRRDYGLSEDFILYMGGLDHRKNVISLVEAFAEVRRRMGSSIQLAIAGQPAKVSPLFPDVRGAVRREGVDDAVVFLGPVAENDRPLLYNAAKLFVFPSLYEGFGLPPLEAMACGTPVICSNSSSLPEVVGDAAILYEPTNQGELVQAMLGVLTNERLRTELRRRGVERAGQFSWAKTARETLDVYRAVAAPFTGCAGLFPYCGRNL